MRIVSVTRPTDGQRITLMMPGSGNGVPQQAFSGLESYMREWEQDTIRAFNRDDGYLSKMYVVKSLLLVGVTVLAGGLAVALIMKR